MAQFDHYATWNDTFAMLREVFARGDIEAFLTDYYPAAEAPYFTSLTPALEARLREGGALYLRGSYSTHPPVFYQQQGGPNAGKYYLREVGGGPLMMWMLANENVVDGQLTILPGML